MIVSKPADLLQMSEGVVPEAITGILTNLQANPVSGGEGDKQYKFQNATLTQDGSSIRIVFSNRDDVPQDFVGQQIVAKTRKNDKGLYGLKRKTGREYQGERPPEIWVYAGAELSVSDGINEGGNSTGTTAEIQPSNPETNTTTSTEPDGWSKKTKQKYVQMANCMSLCYDAALFVAKTQKEKNDYEMTEGQVQAIASSFFIKSDRNGLVDTMPQSPFNS